MGTHPSDWKSNNSVVLDLPSGNQMTVCPPDIQSLVMSEEIVNVPNGLLEQISNQISGLAPDRELVCHSGLRLPDKDEPISQGATRGTVIKASGSPARFVVKVNLMGGQGFVPGQEVRFGGNNIAIVESDQEARWRPTREDLPQMGKFIKAMVRAASIHPKLVVDVKDAEKEMQEDLLSPSDRLFIFQWAMPTEVRPAAKFPEESTTSVVATPDVQSLSLEPSG